MHAHTHTHIYVCTTSQKDLMCCEVLNYICVCHHMEKTDKHWANITCAWSVEIWHQQKFQEFLSDKLDVEALRATLQYGDQVFNLLWDVLTCCHLLPNILENYCSVYVYKIWHKPELT